MKKMRRLIPAIAMLLVSAVMLSTATFAWFTLNDQVTASGMQIQAQASGSLIISDEPLTYASAATKVDLTSGNNKLKPMTWGLVTEDDPATTDKDETAYGWVVADATIDPDTGHFVDPTKPAWEVLDFSKDSVPADDYYIEKVLYVGSAGDTLKKHSITIDLEALAAPDSLAAKAYAIAIYVNEYRAATNDWAPTPITQAPTATIYVDDLADRNTVTLGGTDGYTIPTIVGVGAQDEKVTGLQIVIRFFVDGELDAITGTKEVTDAQGNVTTELVYATKSVVTGYEYKVIDKTAATFSQAGAYYVPVYEYNAVETANAEDARAGKYYVETEDGKYVAFKYESTTVGDTTTDNLDDYDAYYTKDVVEGEYELLVITEDMTDWPAYDVYSRTVKEEDKPYKLVNSDDVPTKGTSLEITIKATDLDPND